MKINQDKSPQKQSAPTNYNKLLVAMRKAPLRFFVSFYFLFHDEVLESRHGSVLLSLSLSSFLLPTPSATRYIGDIFAKTHTSEVDGGRSGEFAAWIG